MAEKRLFIALTPPASVQGQITVDTSENIKTVPPCNRHITLRFLGNRSEDDIPAIEQAMSNVSIAPFTLVTGQWGAFPHGVLWLGLEESQPLQQLKTQLDEALLSLGIAKEMRSYIPHITAARGKAAVIVSCLKGIKTIEPMTFQADKITLYASETHAEGVRYAPLFQHMLQDNPA